MTPTFAELGGMAGVKVRLNDPYLLTPRARSPNEVFIAREAPAPGMEGNVVLVGLLSEEVVTITSRENVIKQVVEEG